MAVKKVIVSALFFLSVLVWGIYGIFTMLLLMIKSPKVIFQRNKHLQLPNCATDASLGTHETITLTLAASTTTTANDKQLKVKYVANGEVGLPLMLCVHGFPECWYSWRHQLKEFSKKYRVVAIDLPGYGDSDKPAGKENYKVEVLTDVIACIITELGYERATVVGHDWGGALLWNFIVTYGDMCEKAIIMNAPNNVGFRKGFTFKQYCMSWYMFFFQLPWIPELMLGWPDFMDTCFRGPAGVVNKSNMSEEDVDVYKYALHTWTSRTCAIDYYRANIGRSHGKGFALSCPTLLVWGTEDQALSLGLAAKSANASELITLEYVEEASHWVQQDKPEEVNRLMWKFLN